MANTPEQIPLKTLPENGRFNNDNPKGLFSHVESVKIYTRKVEGFYQKLRRYTGIPLLLGFLLMPWLSIEGRPAIFFDLTAQKFHIFWMSFWPQDGVLLSWLLIMAAFGLFAVTVFVGRIWCGFTCPQTVWTMIFIWIEDKCEGDRNQRIKLDKQAWSLNKIGRKGSKHFLWLLVGFITALTFVGYFYNINELVVDIANTNVGLDSVFWLFLFTTLTYLNAGWLREQVCMHMCPYSRFQSVMYDKDTLLVSYDVERGEPRGYKKANQPDAEKKGDCIDCSWCVQVCPVDIDIRDGLQYECIDCGLCVDACNNVMDKLELPRGLISYTSERALETGKLNFLRPRLIGYASAVVIMIVLFAATLMQRVPVSLDVIKDRSGALYYLSADNVENTYIVKVNNMQDTTSHYILSASGNNQYQIDGSTSISVKSGETYTLQLSLVTPADDVSSNRDTVTFKISNLYDPKVFAEQESKFIAPR